MIKFAREISVTHQVEGFTDCYRRNISFRWI
jgi:hypothetical protein